MGDFLHRISYRFRMFLRSIKNLFVFFKPVWRWRGYDYSFHLVLLRAMLNEQSKTFENDSNEIEETLTPKVQKMKRAVEILDNILDDRYTEIAEAELGLKYGYDNFNLVESDTCDGCTELVEKDEAVGQINSKILERVITLEKEEWEELFTILRGSGDVMDGTDIRGWWW
jgi:hypothetical protein